MYYLSNVPPDHKIITDLYNWKGSIYRYRTLTPQGDYKAHQTRIRYLESQGFVLPGSKFWQWPLPKSP
jgi:hypothetical protein